jgi:glycerol-3-phosphate dehydrogenase (NAD(P)+)
MTSVSVLGAGAWGTGLALTAFRAGNQTTLWSPFDQEIQSLKKNKEHTALLPGIPIPKDIQLTTDLASVAQADIILLATPAQVLRKVLRELRSHLKSEPYLIICSKGIELESAKLLSEVLEEEIPGCSPSVIGGPNFAREVALDLPAAATLASPYQDQSQWLASTLSHPYFFFYPSQDVKGVEIASAVKNVLAIACGLVTGAQLGENARAALITQGIAELVQIGTKKGCQLETFLGYSGVGDIVLTCTSQTSRNMKLGFDLASGKSLDLLKSEGSPLTEGAFTVKALIKMAQSLGIKLPICDAVHRVLYENKDIKDEIRSLFRQSLRINA